MAIAGTSLQPSCLAARIRPWPAMTRCSASINTGTFVGDVPHLLAAMEARIPRIEF